MPVRASAAASRARTQQGFSLLEMLAVIALFALLAGAMAPALIRDVARQHQRRTVQNMKAMWWGIAGNPAENVFGYLGDVGRFPTSLEDLNQAAGVPGYAFNAGDGVGYGYNGPYAPSQREQNGTLVDAWSNPYQYDPLTGQIRSAGHDRTFATGDDLLIPPNPANSEGDVSITVLGIPNTGGPPEQLDNARVDVFLTMANDGARNEIGLAGNGPYTATNIHLGSHAVRAEGTGTYAGAEARDVLRIRGSQTSHTLVLVQP